MFGLLHEGLLTTIIYLHLFRLPIWWHQAGICGILIWTSRTKSSSLQKWFFFIYLQYFFIHLVMLGSKFSGFECHIRYGYDSRAGELYQSGRYHFGISSQMELWFNWNTVQRGVYPISLTLGRNWPIWFTDCKYMYVQCIMISSVFFSLGHKPAKFDSSKFGLFACGLEDRSSLSSIPDTITASLAGPLVGHLLSEISLARPMVGPAVIGISFYRSQVHHPDMSSSHRLGHW